MDIENPMVINSYWPTYKVEDQEDFYERADLEYESRLDFGGERLWQS